MPVVPLLIFYVLGVVLAALGSVVTAGGFSLLATLRYWGKRPQAPKASAWCAGVVVAGIALGLCVAWVTGTYGNDVEAEGAIGILAGAVLPGMGLLLTVPQQQAWLLRRVGLPEATPLPSLEPLAPGQ